MYSYYLSIKSVIYYSAKISHVSNIETFNIVTDLFNILLIYIIYIRRFITGIRNEILKYAGFSIFHFKSAILVTVVIIYH